MPKYKANPKMVLLKSVIEKETDEGRLCRVYVSPEECAKFAGLLNEINENSARVDIHIRDREGDHGSFTSGFIFVDQTNGGYSGKKGKYKGFKDKKASKPSAKALKKAQLKKKYQGKKNEEE